MKFSSVLLILSLTSTFFCTNLFAIKATPYPVNITQPDGTVLTVRIHGDESFNYKTTLDGYPLITDKNDILTYALADSNGKLISTSMKATNIESRSTNERRFIKKLNPEIVLSQIKKQSGALKSRKVLTGLLQQNSYPVTGRPKSLVILVNFNDLSFVTPDPKTAFSNLLNQDKYAANGGTGSANNYFQDSSNGVFNPEFDVVGPYTLSKNMGYYGGNNAYGDDRNPQQMVIDACALAAANGVDFSMYDTDNDGIVDNVFIYYAGFNEAEGGPKSSIWPHRWGLPDNSTIFNGVSVSDYACTSELRSNSGTNMCGIGTFCHEFSHVLGLTDYYDTDGTIDHHTLSEWNIMDYGPYLNSGRTPPSYSAYDRFLLNWLKPVLINDTANYSLQNLTASNTAYLISQSGSNNLIGANPSPTEFYLLENRQQTGWDTYLPGHGMLITHIQYNPITWANNTVNNDDNAMGVDIVEADGIALSEKSQIDYTLAGDPFPGSSNVTSKNLEYTVQTGNSSTFQPITAINETGGNITFSLGAKFVETSPEVATSDSVSIIKSIITVGGKVISEGSSTIIAKGICWSTTMNPLITNTKTNDGSGAGSFTSFLTGLADNTLYHYRAYATNSTGTSYGADFTFKTLSLPNISTAYATNISANTVTTGGNILCEGSSTVVTRGICWSHNPIPTILNDTTVDGTGGGSFVRTIKGLSFGTTYFLRAYATNSSGTSYGEEIGFSTTEYTGVPGNTVQNFDFYPNPTRGIVNIQSGNNNSTGYTFGIINSLGDKIYSSTLNTTMSSVDISTICKPGLYIIQILNRDGMVVCRKKILFN
jgi:M6 family metalloprotease-like protein